MSDIKSVVAKNIAELRQANGMTQLELAEKLNYSDKAVSKWERGDSMPDISVLVEIADLFHVSLDYLIHEDHTAAQAEAKAEEQEAAGYTSGGRSIWVNDALWAVAKLWKAALLRACALSTVLH